MAGTALNAKVIEIERGTKAVINRKATEIENKIPDTSHFINTQEFSRLTKIRFNRRMKET